MYGGQVGGDSGGDVIILGGSGQPRSELEALVEYYQEIGTIKPSAHITILEDKWPENPFGFEVSKRLEQLYAELTNGHTNVMLLGFSEGAATIVSFLWQLANDPGGTAQKMGSTPASEISAAVLFECTAGISSMTYGDHSPPGLFPGLDGLPRALTNAELNIRLADVWNINSVVHGQPANGWEKLSYPYSSTPGLRENTLFGLITKCIIMFDINAQHGHVLRSQDALDVMHDTFYP